MKLTLPAFFTTNESKKKEEIDGSCLLTDGEIRRIVLFNVTSLSQIIDDDDTLYPHLFSGGTAYIIPMKIREVERLIDLAMSSETMVDGFSEWKNTQKENA